MNHKLSEIDCSNLTSVLVVGKSRKNDRVSNGVGKTTLFRAIEYALYNQSHATSLDKVVKDGKKKAIVEFDFLLGGEIYRIYRHRTSTGTSDVRFYQLDQATKLWNSITQRTATATDAKIRDVIKLSHKAFTYSVLFRQADLTGISSVDDPKKRKEILKEPLNLLQYSKLEEIAAKKARPVKREIERLETSISMLGEPDVDITKASQDLAQCQDDVKKKRQEIVDTNVLINDRKTSIENLKLSLNADDLSIHTKIAAQEAVISELNKSISQQNRTVKALSDEIKISETGLRLISKKTEDTQKILEELLSQPTRDLGVIQAEKDKVSADRIKGSELIAEVKAEMRLLKKSLPDGDNCPSCHQSITEEYRKKVETDVQADINKKQSDLVFYEDALAKCQKKLTKLDTELNAAKERASNIKLKEGSLQSLESEKMLHQKHLEKSTKDKEAAESKWKDDDAKLNHALEHFNSLKDLAGKSNVSSINNKIFSLQEEIDVFQKSLELFESRLTNLTISEGALRERIKTRTEDKEKLTNLTKQLEKNQRELRVRQLVTDSFSQRGIPTLIIQTVLDDLQYEVNVALKEIRPEFDVQIDADLNIEYRRFGDVRDYAQLSHGQQVYLALAFKRGLSKVIQKRLGVDIKMLNLDEVDSALDESGVEAFADSIAKWQKDFTVFVITHNKDLKDKFSSAILVEETDDGSEAHLVNTW